MILTAYNATQIAFLHLKASVDSLMAGLVLSFTISYNNKLLSVETLNATFSNHSPVAIF